MAQLTLKNQPIDTGLATTPDGVASLGGTPQQVSMAGTKYQKQNVIKEQLQKAAQPKLAVADVLQRLGNLNQGSYLASQTGTIVAQNLAPQEAAQGSTLQLADGLDPKVVAIAQQYLKDKDADKFTRALSAAGFGSLDMGSIFKSGANIAAATTTAAAAPLTLAKYGPQLWANVGSKQDVAAALGVSDAGLDSMTIDQFQQAVRTKYEKEYNEAAKIRAQLASLPAGSTQREALVARYKELVGTGEVAKSEQVGGAVQQLESVDKITVPDATGKPVVMNYSDLLKNDQIATLVKAYNEGSTTVLDGNPILEAIKAHVDKIKGTQETAQKSLSESVGAARSTITEEKGIAAAIKGTVGDKYAPMFKLDDWKTKQAAVKGFGALDTTTKEFLAGGKTPEGVALLNKIKAAADPTELLELVKRKEIQTDSSIRNKVLNDTIKTVADLNTELANQKAGIAAREAESKLPFVTQLSHLLDMDEPEIREAFDVVGGRSSTSDIMSEYAEFKKLKKYDTNNDGKLSNLEMKDIKDRQQLKNDILALRKKTAEIFPPTVKKVFDKFAGKESFTKEDVFKYLSKHPDKKTQDMIFNNAAIYKLLDSKDAYVSRKDFKEWTDLQAARKELAQLNARLLAESQTVTPQQQEAVQEQIQEVSRDKSFLDELGDKDVGRVFRAVRDAFGIGKAKNVFGV